MPVMCTLYIMKIFTIPNRAEESPGAIRPACATCERLRFDAMEQAEPLTDARAF